MTFAQPWVLLALLLIPAVLVAWVRGMRRGRVLARSFSRAEPPPPRYAAAGLLALSAGLIVVAAAQPQWGQREAFVPRSGAQLVIVLDISRSMAVTDVAPTRLEAAKTAITTTLSRLGGDRVGLVIFAGSGRLRVPLTTDFLATAQVVREIEPGQVLVSAGTDTSSGLDIALSAFDPESESGRLMVLITDGDDLGVDPAGVARRVRDSGVGLIVVGAGTAEGGVVQVPDVRAGRPVDKLDAAGRPIVSKLNETFLRALAAASGGRYAGTDLKALPGIIEGRIAELKRARIEQQTASLPIERYPWFAATALVMLGLATLAEQLPRKKLGSGRLFAAVGLAVSALLVGACATGAFNLNAEGIAAFARGDFGGAADRFIAAQAEKPNEPAISLNLAAALHAAGKYEEANLAARRALNARDSETRGRAYASIGHHRFAQGDLAGALDSFRQALIENPADEASRHDYEVVLKLLQPAPDQAPEASPTPTPAASGTAGSGTPSPTAGASETATPPAGPNGSQDTTPSGRGPSSAGASSTPRAGGSPTAGSSPAAGSGEGDSALTPGQAATLLPQLDRQIQQLVEAAGNEPSAAQAVAILDLLAERARIAAIRDSAGGKADPKDY